MSSNRIAMNQRISIIVVMHNEEAYIKSCIQSILNQSISVFELIIIDDSSTDKSTEIVKKFSDPRVRLYRNTKHEGIAVSRNRGIKFAKGDYIFFTDADCLVNRYWLEEGMRIFKSIKCVGIQGRIIYANEKPTILDKMIYQSRAGGEYNTCNIVYTTDILRKMGGFNEEYLDGREDTDLALRVLSHGSIKYSSEMIVIHQLKKWNTRMLVNHALNTKYDVKLLRNHPTSESIHRFGRILHPIELLFIFFPPLLLSYRFSSIKDVLFVPLFYAYLILRRLVIIKSSIREWTFYL